MSQLFLGIVFAVVVAGCATTSQSIEDNVTIPDGAVDCGIDSQVGPSETWTYTASTCIRNEVENGANAWMVTDFTDPDGQVGRAVLVVTSDGSLRRYAEAADGTVLTNDLCASTEWSDAGDNEYAISGVECRPAG